MVTGPDPLYSGQNWPEYPGGRRNNMKESEITVHVL